MTDQEHLERAYRRLLAWYPWEFRHEHGPEILAVLMVLMMIGEVVTGKKQGRRSDDEITLFDSTGIALQDSATVPLEYERAVAAGVGIEKKMIST